jgi:hypothetical protein
VLQAIKAFFDERGQDPLLVKITTIFDQVVGVLGPTCAAKGNLFELVIIASLMTKQWTVDQLLDTFLPQNESRPGWCRAIADHVIQFHKCGHARDHGYANDLQWLQHTQAGYALMPCASTGPGYLCFVLQVEEPSSLCRN